MKNLLIVEKDDAIREIIKEIVFQHFPEFAKISSCSTVTEALEKIKTRSPDLVLLDIHLPDGTAFDLLQQVEIFDFKIVFLSEENYHYNEEIQFSSVDVITKPFDMADMVSVIDKACEAIDERDYHKKIEILLSNAGDSASAKMVVFPTLEICHATPLSSILYGAAVAGGCIIHLDSEKEYFIPHPLRHYEQLFSNYGFIRCHPLYVVNLKKVQKIDKESSTLFMEHNLEIPFEQRKFNLLQEKVREAGCLEY